MHDFSILTMVVMARGSKRAIKNENILQQHFFRYVLWERNFFCSIANSYSIMFDTMHNKFNGSSFQFWNWYRQKMFYNWQEVTVELLLNDRVKFLVMEVTSFNGCKILFEFKFDKAISQEAPLYSHSFFIPPNGGDLKV